MVDIIAAFAIAFLFGLGTNSYYGFLAYAPLLLAKFLCYFFIYPGKVAGGLWMELRWRKLMPRGFEGHLPNTVLSELNKIPGDVHFVIPRPYLLVIIKIFMRNALKASPKNVAVPMNFSRSQQDMAHEALSSLAKNIVNLKKGQIENKQLPFGHLKVTRY